jgi:hypothetical protein
MDRNYKVRSPVYNHSPVHEPELELPREPSPEVEFPSDMNVEEVGNGFYISFGDSDAPKKPKPKLRQKRRKEEVHEEPTVILPVEPAVRQPVPQPVASEASPPTEPHAKRNRDIQKASYTVPVDIQTRTPKQEVVQDDRKLNPSPPGVGFVIGQDEAILKEVNTSSKFCFSFLTLHL